MTVSTSGFSDICQKLDLTLHQDYPFITELQSVYDHMLQIMGDDSEAIRSWMHTPKKQLNNKPPCIYLKTQEGLALILKLLRRELEMDSLIG